MKKQLILQLARFGDIIQSKRLVLSLLAEGEVHICVDRSLAELARLVYPYCGIHALPAHGCDARTVLTEGRTVLEELRNEHFDTVYTLNNAGLCKSVATMFPHEIVRGYSMYDGQALRCRWMRMAFRWMRHRRCSPLHISDFWASLAPNPCPPSQVNPGASPGGKGLGVVLAGQVVRRSAPPEILAQLIRIQVDRLGGTDKVPVYLFGTSREHAAARSLKRLLPGAIVEKCQDLTGKTDWAALKDALTGLDLLLSPDTGTAHFAAHLGVPVLGLYCSSAWAWETGPYGAGHTVLQVAPACAPCVESSECEYGASCRNAFSEAALLAYLAGHGRPEKLVSGAVRILSSVFDEMGQTWKDLFGAPGRDAELRGALRTQLAEYLGIGTSRGTGSAQSLYREEDWVFPPIMP